MTDAEIDAILDGEHGDEVLNLIDLGNGFHATPETIEAIRNNPPKPGTLFGIPVVFEEGKRS